MSVILYAEYNMEISDQSPNYTLTSEGSRDVIRRAKRMQKTKTAVMKETVKCSHNLEYGYSMWSIIVANKAYTLEKYMDDFGEYEYDLCKSCMDTVVNESTVEQWIAKEKELVEEVLVCRFESHDSWNKGRDAEARKFYDRIPKYEAAIKTIRRNMVNHISGVDEHETLSNVNV
jgi:hypothetical protein